MDQIRLRPLEPGDGPLLQEIFDQLGPTSRYQRFLVPKLRLTSYELRVLTAIDHDRHEALVALTFGDDRPVGVARFVRGVAEPDVAEVALAVVDAWHRRGVGSLLIDALVTRAVDLQVHEFAAVLAHDNVGALRLLHRAPGELGRVKGVHGVAEYRLVLPTAC
ncbi:MAG: GNAT family N-acetyltransferase [Marmoricola sp.]